MNAFTLGAMLDQNGSGSATAFPLEIALQKSGVAIADRENARKFI
jgi:hypothetical protein